MKTSISSILTYEQRSSDMSIQQICVSILSLNELVDFIIDLALDLSNYRRLKYL